MNSSFLSRVTGPGSDGSETQNTQYSYYYGAEYGDAHLKLASVAESLSGETKVSYYIKLRLKSVADATGSVIYNIYDLFRHVTKKIDSSGRSLSSSTMRRLLTRQVASDGSVTLNIWDAVTRKVFEVRSSGKAGQTYDTISMEM